METYQEFLDRIASFEIKEINYGDKYFRANPSLAQKVGKDNKFRNFYGDTVVFALEDPVKEKLAEYTDLLYLRAPQCFCEKLAMHTFHVTLHDLSNTGDPSSAAQEMLENERAVTGKMAQLQKYAGAAIKMKNKYIFNMVDISLVMGLYPADADGYRILTELYSVFDSVKKLDYPFTPHITLAYYNINGFDERAARSLEKTVSQLNNDETEIELNVDDLYYQKFTSMNRYINIVNLGKRAKNTVRNY